MAIKKYSKSLSLQIMLVLFLSWMITLGHATIQWFLQGYQASYRALSECFFSQKAATLPVYSESLLEMFSFQWNTAPLFHLPAIKKWSIEPWIFEYLQKSIDCFNLFLLSGQFVVLKLIILIAALPLFALSILMGFVDGLNQRAIRTACLGRESSYVFHRLNHYFKKGLFIALMLWLILPLQMPPSYVFVPASLLTGFMVSMTTSRFKKYL